VCLREAIGSSYRFILPGVFKYSRIKKDENLKDEGKR
jgi:hypothetical protein